MRRNLGMNTTIHFSTTGLEHHLRVHPAFLSLHYSITLLTLSTLFNCVCIMSSLFSMAWRVMSCFVNQGCKLYPSRLVYTKVTYPAIFSDCSGSVGCEHVSRVLSVLFLHNSTIHRRTHDGQVGGC